MTGLVLDIQRATNAGGVPEDAAFERWSRLALEACADEIELTIRVVDEEESARLNSMYRNRPGPTNVLSFPFEAPPGAATNLLGDLVICAPVVEREAREQGKPAAAHWAHMVVHGVLHLRGFDHESEAEATRMETLECALLTRMGYDDPYAGTNE